MEKTPRRPTMDHDGVARRLRPDSCSDAPPNLRNISDAQKIHKQKSVAVHVICQTRETTPGNGKVTLNVEKMPKTAPCRACWPDSGSRNRFPADRDYGAVTTGQRTDIIVMNVSVLSAREDGSRGFSLAMEAYYAARKLVVMGPIGRLVLRIGGIESCTRTIRARHVRRAVSQMECGGVTGTNRSDIPPYL